jgi:predicted phage-related endonuclease
MGIEDHATVTSYATRAEWLAARSQPDTIGASEAAIALGVSPYGTPWTLWERKRTTQADTGSEVMQRGNRWESAVLAEYEDASGNAVCAAGDPLGMGALISPPTGGRIVMLESARLPWLRQTPDAFARDRSGELGQVEAKTAMQARDWTPEPGLVIESWRDDYADLVPAHYAVQGYVQLIVSGLPWVDLCALVPRGMWLAVRYVRLQRDPETMDALELALTEWRQRHLVNGEPPELDGSDACNRYLAGKFASANGKNRPERTASAEERELMAQLNAVRQLAKHSKERGDVLRNALLASAEGLRLRAGLSQRDPYGQPQATGGGAYVDMDALRREAPELVARHTKQKQQGATFRTYRFDNDEDTKGD